MKIQLYLMHGDHTQIGSQPKKIIDFLETVNYDTLMNSLKIEFEELLKLHNYTTTDCELRVLFQHPLDDKITYFKDLTQERPIVGVTTMKALIPVYQNTNGEIKKYEYKP